MFLDNDDPLGLVLARGVGQLHEHRVTPGVDLIPWLDLHPAAVLDGVLLPLTEDTVIAVAILDWTHNAVAARARVCVLKDARVHDSGWDVVLAHVGDTARVRGVKTCS